MGIRISCPNGHSLNVKAELAGKRGICPECGAQFLISVPAESTPTPAVAAPSDVPVPPPVSQPVESAGPEAIPELTIAPQPASPQARSIRQRVQRRRRVAITLWLAALVVILGGVLIWIILRSPGVG